jgi:hypothetical protein
MINVIDGVVCALARHTHLKRTSSFLTACLCLVIVNSLPHILIHILRIHLTTNHTLLLTTSLPNTDTPSGNRQTPIPPNNAHAQHSTDRAEHQRHNAFGSKPRRQRRDARIGTSEIKPILCVTCGVAFSRCVCQGADVPVILRDVERGSIVVCLLSLELQRSFNYCGDQAGVYVPFDMA